MTKRCIICKIEPSPICKRSFHMFPKNESIRRRWLDALNLSKTPNFKTAYICSAHFDKESFLYTCELRQRNRLCQEAVPRTEIVNLSDLQIECDCVRQTKKSAIISTDDCKLSDVTEDTSLEVNADDKTELRTGDISLKITLYSQDSNVLNDIISPLHIKEEPEMCIDEMSCRDSFHSQESNVLENVSLQSIDREPQGINTDSQDSNELKHIISPVHIKEEPEMCIDEMSCRDSFYSQESNVLENVSLQSIEGEPQGINSGTDTTNDNTSNNEPTSKKREKVRFMNGFRTEYMCRKDFVSEEAWNRFLRFLACKRSKIIAANRKNSRQREQIQSLKAALTTLVIEKRRAKCP